MALAEAKEKILNTPVKAMRGKLRVAMVLPYLEGREKLCARNLYPRSHLWGVDAMRESGWEVHFLTPRDSSAHRWAGKLNQWMGRRLGHAEFDWEMLRRADDYDLIYVPEGRLPWTQLARRLGLLRAKIIQWEFVAPQRTNWWRFRNLWHGRFWAGGVDGYACLTEAAAVAFRELNPRAAVRAIQWAPDTTMFPGSDKDGDYFLACGRTNRDYATLLAAAAKVPFPVVLLVSPKLVSGLTIPPNVRFIQGPQDGGTDKGIPYPELIHNWYANARAVLIPRLDLAWDTSGFTNQLEAMAMFRPVLMTRTGRLDLDIEKAGVGMFVAPGDANEWAEKMTQLWNDDSLRRGMRKAAREQIRSFHNLQRFGQDVVEFVSEVATRR